jgi:transcriptional regulator with XRE-family HTH domain|nr:MAG TPA: structural protein [Caudoviricetes sp.]
MEESLQEICREAKYREKMTAQDISDNSDVPLSSVNNFFSSSSKMPSIYTAGPICRVLGVSIDAFFHIQPTPDPSIEAQLAHEQEMNQLRVRAMRHKNYLILGLMILLAIALAYGITIDMLNPNIGLFQK